MRWRGGRESGNVEDRRGGGGGGGGMKIGGGLGLVIVIGGLLLGVDPSTLMGLVGSGGGSSGSTQSTAAQDEQAKFVKVVLADTEDTWNALFEKAGKRYQMPKLVLFTGRVQSACGFQSAAVGPFYCPADNKAYLDLQFFVDLDQRFAAPGDFAAAYVIAHEVGHHIQNLLGTSTKVHQRRRALSKAEGNKLSVKLELQADCYAGVWGHHARKRKMLEAGDLEEGLRAAAAIGDDTLQKRGGGHVQPESWTHGSSKQRVKWFKKGFDTGRMQACDTGL